MSSNKALFIFAGSLILAAAVVAVVLEHMKEINDALGYAKWAAIALAILAALYGAYRLWHIEHMRSLTRLERRHEVTHRQQLALEQTQRTALLQEEAASRKTSREVMQQTLLMARAAQLNGISVNMEYNNDGTLKRFQTVAPQQIIAKTSVHELATAQQQQQIASPDNTAFPAPHDFTSVLQSFRPTTQAIYMLSTVDQPVTVPMSKVCHVGIGGNTGAGKTNITRMLTAQILYCRGQVYMANPNYNPVKLNGQHVEDWRPIVRLLQKPVARDINDINKLLITFLKVFEERKKQADQSLRRGADMFLVLCELPAIIAQDSKEMDIITKITRLLREARQYGIHVISEFQDALISTIGGSSGSRENYNTGYYGGGDTKTAQILLNLEKGEKVSEEGIGYKGSVYLRCESTKARPGRVPFFSNQALYALLGAPPDPMTDDVIYDESETPETFATLTPDGRYTDVARRADATIIDSTLQTRSAMPETPSEFPSVHVGQSRFTGPLDELVDATDATTEDSFPRLNEIQEAQFRAAYKLRPNIDACLSSIRVGTQYRQHVREIITEMKSRGEIA